MTSQNDSKGTEVISNQIYYKQINQYAPRYKYVKIYMSNINGTAVTVTATGTTQVSFKMPYNTTFNLAKSKLVYLVPIQAQTTNTTAQIVSDCWPLGNNPVSFETGNGLQLMNLVESSKFTKILRKLNIPLNEYLTRDDTNYPFPCNVTGATTTNQTGLGTVGSVAYLENQYYQQSGAASAFNVPVMYELSNFCNTILALDKDLYFGQNDMYFKFTIGPVNNWAYQTSTAGAGAGTIATLAPVIGSLQNVYLYLAVEQNPIIIDNLVSQYASSGLKILIDYPFVTKVATSGGANQSVVIPFTPAQGKFLKKVYHTVWNSTENLATALDCENTSGNGKVTSYNTYLDSTKLQDDIVVCAGNTANTTTVINEDDWRINQPECKNSAIFNQAVYTKNWFHCDNFQNPDMVKNAGPVSEQNIRDGLPMERGMQYTFSAATANTAFIHDNFAIFSRDVHISPMGVMFV